MEILVPLLIIAAVGVGAFFVLRKKQEDKVNPPRDRGGDGRD